MLSLFALSLTALALSPNDAAFHQTISNVESMVWDDQVQRMVADEGLVAVNVTWEDTGRSKGSVWGPNISDMTIGVRDTSGALHPMPVIRFDNYNDLTADLDPDDFWLRVGNERGGHLEAESLSHVLKNVREYLHDPHSWRGSRSSLWASRDSHVLVSAQACFLPIPRSGEATFTPVLYNYQSYPGNPAVATIVATREGTSIQVVENDGGYLSEVLYFNDDGERAPFTATRLSDFRASGGDRTTPGWAATEDAGLDVVLIIQVPLKQREEQRSFWSGYSGYEMEDAPMAAAPMAESKAMRSDVEVAVIGHGETEGPYKELNRLDIERDARYPVRVTVQFYKATSNGVVNASDIAEIRDQIDRVYDNGDWVGSLVTGGYTGRPTEWATPPKPQPKDTVWAEPSWSWLKSW